MNVKTTILEGCFIIEPKVFNDDRGCFFESFHQKKFQELTGVKTQFVQDNQSLSQRGVLRGLHFQLNPNAQAKLLRVARGAILDVVVDLRVKSKNFGKWESLEINENNSLMLFIPEGFAHGFCSLANNTLLHYRCTNYRDKNSETGIYWKDNDLAINWPKKKFFVSSKDKKNILFKNFLESKIFKKIKF